MSAEVLKYSNEAFIDDLPWVKVSDVGEGYFTAEYFETFGASQSVPYVTVKGASGQPDYTYSFFDETRAVLRSYAGEDTTSAHDLWIEDIERDGAPYGMMVMHIRNLASAADHKRLSQLHDNAEQSYHRRGAALRSALGGVVATAGLLTIGIERRDMPQYGGVLPVALSVATVLAGVISITEWKEGRVSLQRLPG